MGSEKGLSPFIKKCLVTGGGGFVGKALVKQLVGLGVKVCVIGRNAYPDLESLGVICFKGDISDSEAMAKASSDVDAVFHVAALAGIWGGWQDYYRTNVLGTENVIASCKRNNIRMLIYTSTPSVVFDQKDIKGGTEELPYAKKFLCNYARSKVIAEKIVLESNTPELCTTALRPHLIWGPEDPHLLPRLIESGRKKMLKKVGDGSNFVDISYIDNVVSAHVLAAENLATSKTAAGNAYFISQGTPVNLWDWINDLFSEMNIPRVDKEVSFSTAYRLGGLLELVHKYFRPGKEPKMTRFIAEQLAKSHYFSIQQADKDLNYHPLISTEEGMRRTIQWLRTQ